MKNPVLLGPKDRIEGGVPSKVTKLDDFKAVSVDFSMTDVGTSSTAYSRAGNYIVATTTTTPTYHAHAKTDNQYLAGRVSKATGDDPAQDIRITELLTNTQVGSLHAWDSTRTEVLGDVVRLEGK